MPIEPLDHARARVPQLGRYIGQGDPAVDQGTGVGVPQLVEREGLDPGSFTGQMHAIHLVIGRPAFLFHQALPLGAEHVFPPQQEIAGIPSFGYLLEPGLGLFRQEYMAGLPVLAGFDEDRSAVGVIVLHAKPRQLPIAGACEERRLHERLEIPLAGRHKLPLLGDGEIPHAAGDDALEGLHEAPGGRFQDLARLEGMVEPGLQDGQDSIGGVLPLALGLVGDGRFQVLGLFLHLAGLPAGAFGNGQVPGLQPGPREPLHRQIPKRRDDVGVDGLLANEIALHAAPLGRGHVIPHGIGHGVGAFRHHFPTLGQQRQTGPALEPGFSLQDRLLVREDGEVVASREVVRDAQMPLTLAPSLGIVPTNHPISGGSVLRAAIEQIPPCLDVLQVEFANLKRHALVSAVEARTPFRSGHRFFPSPRQNGVKNSSWTSVDFLNPKFNNNFIFQIFAKFTEVCRRPPKCT